MVKKSKNTSLVPQEMCCCAWSQNDLKDAMKRNNTKKIEAIYRIRAGDMSSVSFSPRPISKAKSTEAAI